MATNKKPGGWRKRTQAVRGGQVRTPFQETSEPLILTAGYAYETAEEAEARFKGESPGYQYTRLANPTVTMFEERMAQLEGAPAARATATGMAAVSAVFLAGSRPATMSWPPTPCSVPAAYVKEILPRFGITTTLVDGGDLAAWQAAMRPQTKLLFVETPSNPTLRLSTSQRWRRSRTSRGARLMVDNAFASPALQRPMEFGAHIVVHSSTKYIDGQGRALGGVILCQPGFPRRAPAGLSCATPDPASAPSMPGCISRAWKPWICA